MWQKQLGNEQKGLRSNPAFVKLFQREEEELIYPPLDKLIPFD